MGSKPLRNISLGENLAIKPRLATAKVRKDSPIRQQLATNLSTAEAYLDIDFNKESPLDVKNSLIFVATILQQAMQSSLTLFNGQTQLHIVNNLQVKSLIERLEASDVISLDELKKVHEILYSRLLFLKDETAPS